MIPASIPNELRKRIYRREHYRCALCDSTRGLQVHHIVSRGRGGGNDPMNLICLCARCHAIAHGERPVPTELANEYEALDIDQDVVETAIAEYMADYYIETSGTLWWPWGGHPATLEDGQLRLHSRFPGAFPLVGYPSDACYPEAWHL